MSQDAARDALFWDSGPAWARQRGFRLSSPAPARYPPPRNPPFAPIFFIPRVACMARSGTPIHAQIQLFAIKADVTGESDAVSPVRVLWGGYFREFFGERWGIKGWGVTYLLRNFFKAELSKSVLVFGGRFYSRVFEQVNWGESSSIGGEFLFRKYFK